MGDKEATLGATLDGKNGLARNPGSPFERCMRGLILMRAQDSQDPGAKA